MIIFENVSLNYPISTKNLSLRKNIINGIFGSNIKKNYIESLKKINLKLEKGVYGLYGANGSGKTSLLKVIAGFAWTLSGCAGVLFLMHYIPLIILIPLFGLELGVAFIQAFVFSILICIYLNDAINLH